MPSDKKQSAKKKAKRYLVNSPAVHAPSTAKENDTRRRRAAKAALHTHPNIIQPHTAAPVGAHHAPRRTSCSVTDGPFGKPRHGKIAPKASICDSMGRKTFQPRCEACDAIKPLISQDRHP
jgi:hypothetical protein